MNSLIEMTTMITSLNDLKEYTRKDQVHYDTSLKSWLLREPSYYIGQYLRCLRIAEYCSNNKNKKILIPIKILVRLLARKYSYKLGGLQIGLNTCGPGLRIFHYGFIIINGKAKIGKNFAIQPGCVVGRTELGEPIIGDNVYMAPNSTIMGKVTIGDNVTVAQNSSVVKDVPANAIVGGVPAKIIKMKTNKI